MIQIIFEAPGISGYVEFYGRLRNFCTKFAKLQNYGEGTMVFDYFQYNPMHNQNLSLAYLRKIPKVRTNRIHRAVT